MPWNTPAGTVMVPAIPKKVQQRYSRNMNGWINLYSSSVWVQRGEQSTGTLDIFSACQDWTFDILPHILLEPYFQKRVDEQKDTILGPSIFGKRSSEWTSAERFWLLTFFCFGLFQLPFFEMTSTREAQPTFLPIRPRWFLSLKMVR